jgi:hypothetical protein
MKDESHYCHISSDFDIRTKRLVIFNFERERDPFMFIESEQEGVWTTQWLWILKGGRDFSIFY